MQKVGIAEAAAHLGLSQDTVRRRLRAGELPGEKVKAAGGFKWMVNVEGTTVFGDPKYSGSQPTSPTEGNTDDNALVELLKERLAAQDNELDARRQEIRELHQLLAARALSDGRGKPWWMFWR